MRLETIYVLWNTKRVLFRIMYEFFVLRKRYSTQFFCEFKNEKVFAACGT